MVEVRGAAIEVQFLHPAAKLMFSQNSIAAGHNTNTAAGETPNFFFMPGEPKPFYDALSDAVIGRAADASLPALLTRTYRSKGWTEAAIPPELMVYAERYADQTHVDAHFSSSSRLPLMLVVAATPSFGIGKDGAPPSTVVVASPTLSIARRQRAHSRRQDTHMTSTLVERARGRHAVRAPPPSHARGTMLRGRGGAGGVAVVRRYSAVGRGGHEAAGGHALLQRGPMTMVRRMRRMRTITARPRPRPRPRSRSRPRRDPSQPLPFRAGRDDASCCRFGTARRRRRARQTRPSSTPR